LKRQDAPSFPAGLVLQYAVADTSVIRAVRTQEEGALAALDFLEFVGQGSLDFPGVSFAAGDTAHVRAIDSELSGYPAVKTAIQLVSREMRLFVIIRRHQW